MQRRRVSQAHERRRWRTEIRRCKLVTGMVCVGENERRKRQKLEAYMSAFCRDSENAVGNCFSDEEEKREQQVKVVENGRSKTREMSSPSSSFSTLLDPNSSPKYGVASFCGRRRDMEDAVAVLPSFFRQNYETTTYEMHYFGVYDGHGCSHVAMRCKERLHELVKEELENGNDNDYRTETTEWKGALERSFARMDKEVCAITGADMKADCRCELQMLDRNAVGSTAVVAIVTSDKTVIANCGDSRAVLCRSGNALPLSSDHKPDRPDELNRIQEAGGRVVYWDGPRVLGILATSRAIGDNYLKPYVSSEPEVTIMDRTVEDEFLILATDGLWDVVSNETACHVARMCLSGKDHATPLATKPDCLELGANGGDDDDHNRNDEMRRGKCCLDASMLLTKLAMARHSYDNVSVIVVDLGEVAT